MQVTIQLDRPQREPPPRVLRVRIPGRVAEQLDAYRELYRDHYGEEIRVEALAAEILGQFLAREPALRKRARERRRDGAGEAPRGVGDGGRSPREP